MSVTSFLPQRSYKEWSLARYRVLLPPASFADGAAELAPLKQSSPAFRLLPRSRQPDKGGHFPLSDIIDHKGEGGSPFVIPSEADRPTRNLLLRTRNRDDCTLAWREIFQGKTFLNDTVM